MTKVGIFCCILIRIASSFWDVLFTQTLTYSNSLFDIWGSWFTPIFNSPSDPLSPLITTVKYFGNLMGYLIQFVSLWDKTCYAGDRVWVYWFIVAPIAFLTLFSIILSFFSRS